MLYEWLYCSKPNLSGVPVWGQSIWVNSGTGSKLDAHALEACSIGFDADSTHAHHMYWPNKRSISIKHDIKCNMQTHILYPESHPPSLQIQAPAAPPQPSAPPQQPSAPPQQPPAPPLAPAAPQKPEALPYQQPAQQVTLKTPPYPPWPPVQPLAGQSQESCTPGTPVKGTAHSATPPWKSSHVWIPSAKEKAIHQGEATTGEEYENPDSGAYANNFISCQFVYLADSEELFEASLSEYQDDPKTLIQAHSCMDWPKWQEAMDCKITTLEHTKTWDTVPCPTNKIIVGSKWAFCIKFKADSTIKKHKA
ncbi:hypothetical protein EI94DRAFT_1810778 [Lactarius quietus]|nr:hypothetical protein EI94DRAFT_1810778 [Lactarius quietus]